jgi:hypothetical protein
MIYEHRTYTLVHGTMADYLARYETHGLPVQMKHLGRLLGFFVSEIGPLNQVVHIWVYDSLADRERRRAAMDADPDWHAFKQRNRGSFTAQEVKILVGAPFCPQHV